MLESEEGCERLQPIKRIPTNKSKWGFMAGIVCADWLAVNPVVAATENVRNVGPIMNPYELPSYSTVCKTCLEQWGKPDFSELFLEEMSKNSDDLPLDDMCEGGSYPDQGDVVECNNLEIDDDEVGFVTGHFQVSFTQLSPTGCRDMDWSAKLSGRIDFTLTLSSGEIKFDPPTVTREYEEDE